MVLTYHVQTKCWFDDIEVHAYMICPSTGENGFRFFEEYLLAGLGLVRNATFNLTIF